MAYRQDYTSGSTPVQAGSPAVGTPNLDPANLPRLPFRIATLERADLIQVDSLTVTANEQLVERTLPGTGFVYGVDLDFNAVASGNAAAVAFQEDGAFIALSSCIFRDVNGEILDLDGESLKWISRYGGWEPWNGSESVDTQLFVKTTGAVGAGGSFRFHTKVPVGISRRTLLGVLGNQDRGQAYILRANLNGSGLIYSVAPTTPATVTINRHYESYVVPNPVNDVGQAQQVVPPFYGVIPYITKSVSPNAPVGGQLTNHFLQRINTTFRGLLLILRSNSLRATAESNLPTNIQFKIGNQSIFNELPAYRRQVMFDRYGFDAPAGMFMYDFLHDFGNKAGAELGNDWYWTQQLTEAQFSINYPAGFGSTGNSLTIITTDMTVPAGMNLYAG